MTESQQESRVLNSLRTAYRDLLDRGVVNLSVEEGDGETVAVIEPVGSTGPRLEIRVTGSVADLFLADLAPFEVDETSPLDTAEFDALILALVAGEVRLVQERGLRGWHPRAIEWPSGAWSLPGRPRVVGLLSKSKRENFPGYV